MSYITDLLAYHADNPIGNILQNYEHNFDTTSFVLTLSQYYFHLADYVNPGTGSNNMDQLYLFFMETSLLIRKREIQTILFEDLHKAIVLNKNEQEILKLSVSVIEDAAQYHTSLITTTNKVSKMNVVWDKSETSGFNKKASHVEKLVKDDLDYTVFSFVPNFWETFFENKAWSKQTSRIWESYQKYEEAENKLRSKKLKRARTPDETVNLENEDKVKKEKILEAHMTEKEVWDWLKFFSGTFLAQMKGPSPEPSKEHPIVIEEPYFQIKRQYCSTKITKRAIQATGMAQIDFLVKSIDLPDNNVADWENINAIGEFTISPFRPLREKKFLQLSRCVREVFCAQPLRRFLHGFILFKEHFELWLFDRSGAYSSGPKEIVGDKEMFVRAICSYLLMSNEEIGCDMSILHNGEDKYVQFPKIGNVPGESFEINSKPIVQPMRLITRGTTCYETKDKSKVIKYSWSSSEKDTEVDLLNIAKSVRGVVNLIASEVIYETKIYMENLNFSRASVWDLKSGDKFIVQGLEEKQSLKRNRRLIRLLITPRGRAIYSSGSIFDFVAGIRDAIMGHRDLVGKEILHGDISEGNIILLKPESENDLYGTLIDLDHSVRMKGNEAVEDNLTLTGTMKFMALERLEAACENKPRTIKRTCRHDLESFFYVFIVGCIEYERVFLDEANDLKDWCTENKKSNFWCKKCFVQNFETDILAKFTTSFQGLKELAKELRFILFGKDGRDFGTPSDCKHLYDGMIFAFQETMRGIRDGRIENKVFEARRK